MDTPISTDLRAAVVDLVAWYDQMLEDVDSAPLAQLARSIHKLKHAVPYPGGQVGADIAHIIKPPRDATRIDHVQAIERLRLLTRPGVTIRIHAEQLSLED